MYPYFSYFSYFGVLNFIEKIYNTFMKLSALAQAHAEIFWDIPKKSLKSLSDEVIFERFLIYGQWKDIKKIDTLLDLRQRRRFFKNIAYRERSNLHPATISYFQDYYVSKKVS